jgi:hypothetical protein
MNGIIRRELGARVPLSVRLGRFAGFEPGRSKQAQIQAILAPLIRQDQSEQPKRFYSMREVCAFFGVALRTAGIVYRRMESEGLLVRMRGTGTVVPARTGNARNRTPVRGMVALLNWLPGFLQIADQRFFVMRLEESLWAQGYATAVVFYHEEEKRQPAFAERILAHRPDFAIWLVPGMADIPTMGALADVGVRVIAIANRSIQMSTPVYAISWRRGVETALRAWKQEGVHRVIIPAESRRHSPFATALEDILHNMDMTFSHALVGDEAMPDYVDRIAAQPVGVVFDYDIWHARVCTQAPRAFARLLAKRRVLNCWSLPIQAGVLGDIRTDAVLLPWDRIVDRIVEDLKTGAIFRQTADRVFHAEWTPRVTAACIAKFYDFETK